MSKTKVQIAREIERLCIEECVVNDIVNIADVIYEYIDSNRESLIQNEAFPLEDDDEYAEEIAIIIDEDTIYDEATEIRSTRIFN